MEAGDVDTVIKEPQHPYTRLLVDSIPWPNLDQRWGEHPIKARAAGVSTAGCPFLPRCPSAMEICETQPPLFQVDTTTPRPAISMPNSPRSLPSACPISCRFDRGLAAA